MKAKTDEQIWETMESRLTFAENLHAKSSPLYNEVRNFYIAGYQICEQSLLPEIERLEAEVKRLKDEINGNAKFAIKQTGKNEF